MRLLPLLLLSLALPAGAQIYQYQDANGNTVFTNQLPDGQSGEPVNLPPANQVQISAPTAPAQKSPSVAPAKPFYQQLTVVNLPTDEALRANNGTFTVQAQLLPALRPGHSIQLLLDGQPYGTPNASGAFLLSNIDRGDHSLVVQVLQGAQVVQSSAPMTFTVQRVHIGNKPKPL